MPAKILRQVPCDVKDIALADAGKLRTEGAFQSMPVLQIVRKQFIKTQPFSSARIAACLPLTAEFANLVILLKEGGAFVSLCASNPATTQDDVAAHLARDHGIPTFAAQGVPPAVFEEQLNAALEHHPNLVLDERAILAAHLMLKRSDLLPSILGGVELSAAGISRIRGICKNGAPFPILSVTDSRVVRMVENRHGWGQTAIDTITRTAGILLAGQIVVVSGYGFVGRGIAQHARGAGAHVVITEIDPAKALEALLDGFRVTSALDASDSGDIFITATGGKSVLCRDHFTRMKNNAILYNAGHSNVEIDVEVLARLANSRRPTRDLTEEFRMNDGRRLYLIGEGRRVPTGLPAAVIDINSAVTGLAVDALIRNQSRLEKCVHSVSEEIDRSVARIKIDSLHAKLDRQTTDQERYVPNGIE